MNPSGISIVIPAYNEEKFLPATVGFLIQSAKAFESRFQKPWEIIVVNNLSTDATVAVAEKLGARVVNHEVRNIASVRNAGIRAAKYELVVTIDADNEVPVHTFEHIWEKMSSGQYVGGGVRVKLASEHHGRKMLVSMVEGSLLYVAGLSMGLFYFWKSAAEDVKGFPENYLVGEDSAYALLLKRYGRQKGLKYCHLHSVTMLTADRKAFTSASALRTVWNVLRQFAGRPVTREQLDFWYRPDR